MLKLYEFWTNNGDWGGYHSEYVVAENEEEVWKKCPYAAGRVENGCDYFIRELTPEDVLKHFIWDKAKCYKVNFAIEEKRK